MHQLDREWEFHISPSLFQFWAVQNQRFCEQMSVGQPVFFTEFHVGCSTNCTQTCV